MEKSSTKHGKLNSTEHFFLVETKAKAAKTKNKQVGLHQTKSFCTGKKTISKMKRQSTEWQKIFANHTADKG